MGFTDELRRETASLWERMVTHPFVRELGDGTLPQEKFRRYFCQDYLFVRGLVQLLALAVAKAPSFDAARRLSRFLDLVLTGEEALFQRAFRQMGLSPKEVEGLTPLPSCLSHTSYLLRLAYEGTFQELLLALLVTEWTYLDWAQRLAAAGKRPENPAYREWIEIHSGRELEEFVVWMRDYLDTTPVADRKRLEEVFATALRYELLFWEMAYRGEEWPA
ncbi:MAG: TenA family protein [Dehalococcoidia bacterium]